MDQKTFNELKKQAMINVIGNEIGKTGFRLARPLNEAHYEFDCNYRLEQDQAHPLQINTTAKNPMDIKAISTGFSSLALSKALHILLQNQDLTSINLPCNIQIDLETGSIQPKNLFDVQLVISVRQIEIQDKNGNITTTQAPVAMIAFYTENAEGYFINIKIDSLLAIVTKLDQKDE